MRLIALDTATCIEDMNTPGWWLHSLKGDRKGLWAIDVNRNWRVVFEFKDGNAYVVDYEDYHQWLCITHPIQGNLFKKFTWNHWEFHHVVLPCDLKSLLQHS